MNKAYLVGRGQIRNGLTLTEISSLKTQSNLYFLLDIYREATNISFGSTEFSEAFQKFENWAINIAHIRTFENLCTPPTDEELNQFDESLVEVVNIGTWNGENRKISQRLINANTLTMFVRNFWNWVKFETTPTEAPKPAPSNEMEHPRGNRAAYKVRNRFPTPPRNRHSH